MAKAKKLPSGNWRARAYDGLGANGKKKYISFTAPTKREAEFLAAEHAAKRKGAYPARDDKTLRECYDR